MPLADMPKKLSKVKVQQSSQGDRQFSEKLSKCKTSLSLNAFLNELKDKKALTRNLAEEILMALSRVDPKSAGGSVLTTFKQFLTIEKEQSFEKSSSFYLRFLEAIYFNGNIDDAKSVQNMLVELNAIKFDQKSVRSQILCCELSASVYEENSISFSEKFDTFKKDIKLLSIFQINNILRVLGEIVIIFVLLSSAINSTII